MHNLPPIYDASPHVYRLIVDPNDPNNVLCEYQLFAYLGHPHSHDWVRSRLTFPNTPDGVDAAHRYARHLLRPYVYHRTPPPIETKPHDEWWPSYNPFTGPDNSDGDDLLAIPV